MLKLHKAPKMLACHHLEKPAPLSVGEPNLNSLCKQSLILHDYILGGFSLPTESIEHFQKKLRPRSWGGSANGTGVSRLNVSAVRVRYVTVMAVQLNLHVNSRQK